MLVPQSDLIRVDLDEVVNLDIKDLHAVHYMHAKPLKPSMKGHVICRSLKEEASGDGGYTTNDG